MLARVVLLLSLAVGALAACPNGCSGHGSCGNDDICTCYQDWLSADTVRPNGGSGGGGGDCSQMKCPYEIAWVDTPSATNQAHALAECAGRGLCDRTTGDCQCFDGYEGKGCKRSACPNACSGHGRCEYIAHLRNDVGDAFKYTGNRPTVDQYTFQFPLLWDAYKSRACVCDPKWTDVDCSRRMCPRGNYALYAHTEPQPETQAVIIKNVFTPGTDEWGDSEKVTPIVTTDRRHYQNTHAKNGDKFKDDSGHLREEFFTGYNKRNGQFALTFRSTLGEEFTTRTLDVYNATEELVVSALSELPNKVIEDVDVVLFRNMSNDGWGRGPSNKVRKAAFATHKLGAGYIGKHAGAGEKVMWYSNDLVILITFSGSMTTGNQFALECKTAYCDAGCQPKIHQPLDFKQGSSCTVVNNFHNAYGVNIECSGRGTCDYTKGVCSCYQGYTDEFCSTQTALI
jgi:hypothetical protein